MDSPLRLVRLTSLGANACAFLIYSSPVTWDDLAEYLALAEPAGLATRGYLVPPTERPSDYSPYEDDYVAWAGAISELAAEQPSITAIAMDDFNGSTTTLTVDYLYELMVAAQAHAPDLKFYDVCGAGVGCPSAR